MSYRELNEEVWFAEGPVLRIGRQDLARLKERARKNRRGRMRICAHLDPEDKLHEMLIVLTGNAYIRPHRHAGKTESFHIIEGAADVVIFEETGPIAEIVRMGDGSSARPFYYRLSEPLYHTVVVRSELIVFHEVTNGPFDPSDTIFPAWAPPEESPEAADYMAYLARSAASPT